MSWFLGLFGVGKKKADSASKDQPMDVAPKKDKPMKAPAQPANDPEPSGFPEAAE